MKTFTQETNEMFDKLRKEKMDYLDVGGSNTRLIKSFLSSRFLALIEKIDGEMPKEQGTPLHSGASLMNVVGYNEALSEVKAKLSSLKEEIKGK
jgi:hypothetical protein